MKGIQVCWGCKLEYEDVLEDICKCCGQRLHVAVYNPPECKTNAHWYKIGWINAQTGKDYFVSPMLEMVSLENAKAAKQGWSDFSGVPNPKTHYLSKPMEFDSVPKPIKSLSPQEQKRIDQSLRLRRARRWGRNRS